MEKSKIYTLLIVALVLFLIAFVTVNYQRQQQVEQLKNQLNNIQMSDFTNTGLSYQDTVQVDSLTLEK